MGDKTPATSTTNTSTGPWMPATGLLQNLIGKYGSINTGVTGDQTDALSKLRSAIGQIPGFGDAASTGVSRLFSSDTSPQIGMLNAGYDTLQKNLGGTASGSELDPYKTPGFSDAIDTASNDITNRVKSVYAASGRDPSGAGSFGQSLGRGLTQGIAPIIQSQFNTNKQNQMNAAGTLYNAAGTTAGGITQQGQVPLTNIMAGIQSAGMIPGLYTAPGSAALNVANTAQNLPFANLQPQLQAGLGLGATGSTSTGTTTQTPANDPMMNIIGAGLTGAGLFFSDRRMKKEVERVGKLPSGPNVYSFKYRGAKGPKQLGLIAQDVRKHAPEAVTNVGGRLAVDYGKVGMLPARKAA